MYEHQSEPERGFAWGAATSAFQVEGGRREGGKGESIWDRFADEGRVPHIERLGCDSYHRWEEDLDLLASLGVDSYRFSVSWPRVMPKGVGEVNLEGIEYYRKIAAGLTERGIKPAVCLYHWDLPLALEADGGWPARRITDHFTSYTTTVVERLGDLVDTWYTINEPWVISMLGYQTGVFAPGVKDWNLAIRAAHHLLLSHGMAVSVIKALDPTFSVGLAIDCRPASAATESPADLIATNHFDGYRNRWFFDPVFAKGYPADTVAEFERRGRLGAGLDFVESGDMDLISQPIDFLGVNYYTTTDVSAGRDEADEPSAPPGPNPPTGHTEMGWRIDPDGLEGFLQRIHREYSPTSIIVSENGASYSDGPDSAGRTRDERRIDYLRDHIGAVARARAAGAPVDGYFAWSLLDNLEWTSGYRQRFGLVWVDHDTGERMPKDSFHWYAGVAAGGPPRS